MKNIQTFIDEYGVDKGFAMISSQNIAITDAEFGENAPSTLNERSNLFQQLGSTVAVILHEVRNPLQTAITFIQTMERVSEDNSLAEYYPKVLDELSRANKLINAYLSFSRKSTEVFVNVDIHSLCHEIVVLLKSGAILKDIKIEEMYPSDPVNLSVDEAYIRQILLNLVLNAFDACRGGGTVYLALEEFDDKVSLTVADDGVGIKEADLQRIFDFFYTSKAEGTGIGLPLVLKLVQMHGGYLEVRSKENKGSAFSVIFPK